MPQNREGKFAGVPTFLRPFGARLLALDGIRKFLINLIIISILLFIKEFYPFWKYFINQSLT
ncbi:hypothetical protein LEP1GSC193_2595 [Leptospira alstonii serovar Pingchang str. 80-412]|uniref:Uncharacterized protein n=2 Tax=Leptospira alstonii TaxID=28452 RepID=M6D1L2_9LEPT|nr:hypothetical protein LEP1GSC194_2635 [Leptospira alstonii serovar Sichuan str. 79601]EQA80912.1 hypothetical protein LEP1GSC193_2595 [Leptospira alstonii serovar Pingchang str. 80-412]